MMSDKGIADSFRDLPVDEVAGETVANSRDAILVLSGGTGLDFLMRERLRGAAQVRTPEPGDPKQPGKVSSLPPSRAGRKDDTRRSLFPAIFHTPPELCLYQGSYPCQHLLLHFFNR
jgi:hypothetical protein